MPGDGSPLANLVFVGEAPGFHEDQEGLPFVGAAGKLLERLLARIGLSRNYDKSKSREKVVSLPNWVHFSFPMTFKIKGYTRFFKH